MASELEKQYLEKNIFVGLKNLNTGFDSPAIYYFSEIDFQIVLERVQYNGLGIYGIEPWQDGEFFDVANYEVSGKNYMDPEWYFNAFQNFKSTGEKLQYAATYYVPTKLLKSNL
jgi:hypothetical protein